MKELRREKASSDPLYLGSFAHALKRTFDNLLGRVGLQPSPQAGRLGIPRLTRDEEGRVKCVACSLCAAACPADCITIEAVAAPWEDREKIPGRFELDAGRCILCGLCVDACPEDALDRSSRWTPVARDRDGLRLQMDALLLR
jgi:formate hydrogenlyase subunit 6/NADH:ubiquinone oxidoreductase subunit I